MKPEKIIKGHLKPPKDFFKWCESYFPIYDFKRKGVVTRSSACTNRRRPIIEKNIRRNSNFGQYFTSQHFVIYLATKKRIEVQTWAYYQSINDDLSENFSFRLSNMELFSNGECYKAGSMGNNHYIDSLIPWTYMSGPYTSARWYSQDHNEVFKTSELRHFDIEPFVCNSYAYKNLTRLYKYRLGLEYIKKLGGDRLFDDITSGKADMRKATKKFIRNNKNPIKRNLGWDDFRSIDKLKQSKIEPNLFSLQYISNHPKLMDVYIEKGQFGKLCNYLVKQKRDLAYYDDYLSFLEQLNVPLNSDQLRYPKDLEGAHDDRLAVVNLLLEEQKSEQQKLLESEAKMIKKKLKILEFQVGNYKIIVPESLDDIVTEGTNLMHCVGGQRYLERHSNGTEIVLFFRKVGRENESFFTFSFDMKNRITQVQGYGNTKNSLRVHIEEKLKKEWLPFAIEQVSLLNLKG